LKSTDVTDPGRKTVEVGVSTQQSHDQSVESESTWVKEQRVRLAEE